MFGVDVVDVLNQAPLVVVRQMQSRRQGIAYLDVANQRRAKPVAPEVRQFGGRGEVGSRSSTMLMQERE